MLRFLTSGESHGQGLVTIIEGMPAGLAIDFDAVTLELRRRQGGYGRGRRMVIETDRAEVLSGHPPRAHHRWADRAAGPQQGLGELAEHHARRGRGAGGLDRREARGGGAAPAGSCRPRRRAEIRSRRHSRCARARQRARNRGACRRRRRSPASCCSPSIATSPATSPASATCVMPAGAAGGVRRGARPRARRRRCAASMRRSSSR